MFTIENLDEIRNKKGFICDMDGVIYHGNRLLPGVNTISWVGTVTSLVVQPRWVTL